MQYSRNDAAFARATFRVRGEVIDIFPAESDKLALRVELFDEEVERLSLFDPLTGAVESTAKTLPEVIQETLLTTTSERQGRAIDKDAGGAGMEVKKQQGYF